MIFFVSTEDNFNNNVLVETNDLNIGSEGTSFQIDNAQLSGLNIFGNSFNIKAKKIYPINKQLPIISSNDITGSINFSSKILIQVKAKIGELNTENNTLKLDGNFKIENDNFKIEGKEIVLNFKNNQIISNKAVTFKFPNGQIDGGKIKIINSKISEDNIFLSISDGVNIKYLL